jgi:hypothetical protein
MGSCSAGDGGRTLSPLARQVARNAVKRVSWKQTACFGPAASKKYELFVNNVAEIDN